MINVPSSASGAGPAELEAIILSSLDDTSAESDNSTPAIDENASVQTDDNKSGDEQSAVDEAETETTEEVSEEAQEEAESEETDAVVKIGNREFASKEDAFKEAERIIGRNAQLAGKVSEKDRTIAEISAKLQEALEANQQFAKAFKKKAGGEFEDEVEEETPRLDPKEFARQAAAEMLQQTQQQAAQERMRLEVQEIVQLPNYDEVSDIFSQLSNQINPLTQRFFTPREAYKYACRELEIDNLLEKKQAPKVEAKKPEKIVKTVTRAAARPNTAPAQAPAPAAVRDEFVEYALAEKFPFRI